MQIRPSKLIELRCICIDALATFPHSLEDAQYRSAKLYVNRNDQEGSSPAIHLWVDWKRSTKL